VSVALVVLAAAVLAGICGFAVSASQAVAIDPRGAIERHPRVRRFLRERFDRDSRRGFVLTAAFGVVAGVALVLGLLLDMVSAGSGLAELDDELAEWGSERAGTTTAHALELVTALGGTPVVIAALTATGVVAYRRRRDIEIPLLLAAVGLGQLVLVNGIKLIVDRDRPNVMRLVEVHGPSFPSGHSCAAAAGWAAVAFVLGHDAGRATRGLLAALAVLIAVAVATSRALLGVHWFTDIVGGLALGWGWFVLVLLAFRTRERTVSAPRVAR
jgi:membrane-associated phospholipid phosphatase